MTSTPSLPQKPWSLPTVTALDRALPDIYRRFGLDTVLVPFRDAVCQLSAEERKSLTLAFTRTISYQSALCAADVAVLCGRVNHGLHGLAFPGPQILRDFLSANSRLAHTLTTETPSGFVLWIRPLDVLPAGFSSGRIRWLADNDAVVLRRRLPWPAGWSASGGAIMAVKVSELNLDCDPDLKLHLLHTVVQGRCGSPFLPGRRGHRTFNATYWAGFVGRLLQVRYRPRERRFECFDPTGQTWLPHAEEVLMHRAAEVILGESRRLGSPFAPSLKHLISLVGELRVQFPEDGLDQSSAVARFLVDQVERCSGHDVTTRELHAAYCQSQGELGLPAISQPVFEQLIGPALATRWGLRRSHSILREGRAKCGFRGIRLMVGAPPTASFASTGGAGGVGGGSHLRGRN